MWYHVDGLDVDGCVLVSRQASSLKQAKAELKIIQTDKEYLSSGLFKIEVRDFEDDECVLDKFVG